MPKQFTKQEAVALYESKFWVELSLKERAMFQLYQSRLCMPFEVYHEAVEKTLNRPVYTHEFAYPEDLKKELEGLQGPPSFEEILKKLVRPRSERV